MRYKKLTIIMIMLILINSAFVAAAGVGHWAEVYVEILSENHGVENLFRNKDLNQPITVENFQELVRLVLAEDYNGRPAAVSREALVHELVTIWADITGQDLYRIPVIKMLIYEDTAEIEPEYYHSIVIAYMQGIARGKERGKFRPADELSYGELATIIYNTDLAIKRELKLKEQKASAGRFETRASYELKDGKVIFDFELVNNFPVAKELQFGSGQQFEVVITDERGEEVYRFSDGKFFTMALIYKTIQPGETLKWQDSWDLTNKEGKKLTTGEYQAEIIILANPVDGGEELDRSQLRTVIKFNLNEIVKTDILELSFGDNNQANEQGIISPELARELIEEITEELIQAIKNRDGEKIAEFVHPVKGVRFTPYTYVSLEGDLVFSREAMKNFFADTDLYLWGYYDGIGSEIQLTPAEYYEEFIYSADFINAPEVGYNKVLSSGNMLENQFDVYDNPIIVEYYFPGFNPEYDGMDWRSLRLVFEEYEGNWKLTGIIHNQWTI
ncbi:MAG: BsuPI-related putative proteinase inhibitor [Halanaerobiales bacterium]